jgi:hypothetical protein
MPRFFFHIRSINQSLSQDKLGLVFPDVETARSEAIRAAEGLEDVFVARGEDPRNHAMEVEDASGDLVFRM